MAGLLLLFCLLRSLAAQPIAKSASSPSKITDERIRFFQALAQRDPDYYAGYNRLASAYLQKARDTGDLSYYELAEKSLKRSLELESQHPEAATALTQLGAVQFAEHRFSEAAASAQRALKLRGDDLAAQSLLGDVNLEIGNYSDAESAFGKLAAPDDARPYRGREYLRMTRQASLAWMSGKVVQALSWMKLACELAEQAHLPAENIAWTYFMLGEQLFQSGNIKGAENAMEAALLAYPSYHRALAGMGQVRAAQHRNDEAVSYYKQAIEVIPLPLYASALGDIYRHLKNEAEAEKQYALVEYIGKLGVLNQQVYNRELALFYADHARHLPESLALAKKELEARHDVYTWDALAWSLFQNGQASEAHDAMEKALAMGTRDALLFFHAAAIERRLSNPQAADYARQAISINPEFHVVYANEARRWATPVQTVSERNIAGVSGKQ